MRRGHAIQPYAIVLTERTPIVLAGLRRAGEHAAACRACGDLLENGRASGYRHVSGPAARIALVGA